MMQQMLPCALAIKVISIKKKMLVQVTEMISGFTNELQPEV
jgi:hypothetical protein